MNNNTRVYTTDNSIDIDELIANEQRESNEKVQTQNSQSESSGLIIEDDNNEDDVVAYAEQESPDATKEYNGPGAIIDAAEVEAGKRAVEAKGVNVGGIKSETMEGVKQWMADADNEIEKRKDLIKKGKVPVNNGSNAPTEIVNIYIDKSRTGDLILSDEEQKRVSIASKINIIETTDATFKSLKIARKTLDVKDEKEKKERKKTIIDKVFDRSLSPFIAIGSGYMGKMGNCSVADIMKLGRSIDSGKTLSSELDRWHLLYDKMKYCSIGKFKSFDEFLKNTAYDDYENLQFALICASYPENTTMEFTCPHCQTKFNVTVSNRSLLRTDRVDDVIAENVKNIVAADTFIERAKEVHENALFNTVSRIAITDDYSIIMDAYSPSAYDAIYRTYQDLVSPEAPEYAAYTEIIKFIKAFFLVVDVDENEEPIYEEFTDPNDILDILTRFSETQMNKIATYIDQSYMSHKYTYGIKDVTCVNDKCKKVIGDYPMSMDNLLFLKVRQQ